MATGCEESASKKQKGHRLASPTAAASNQGRPTEATAVTREGSWALMGVPLQSRASACPGHGALTHSSRGSGPNTEAIRTASILVPPFCRGSPNTSPVTSPYRLLPNTHSEILLKGSLHRATGTFGATSGLKMPGSYT